MTALAIGIAKNAIVLASDGAVTDGDGTLVGFESKVVLLPEHNALIACRGVGGFGTALHQRIGVDVTDFDSLLDYIPSKSAAVLEAYIQHYGLDDAPISIIVAGWSESRQQYEGYRLGKQEWQPKSVGGGEWEEMLPWTLLPIDGCLWARPWPSAELYGRFGIDPKPQGSIDIFKYTATLVCAARFRPESTGPNTPEHYGVGGFLQMTMLERDYISTSIVHRWPDVIGERIDPTHGEALPTFLIDQLNAERSAD